MCPFWCVFFTLNWLTMTPKTHFVQFCLKVASYFLSGAKISMWHWRWGCYGKYIKKSLLVYTRNMYIFCCNSVTNLKLKFWGYNKKNMGFHLTPSKKHYFQLSPGRWDAMGTSFSWITVFCKYCLFVWFGDIVSDVVCFVLFCFFCCCCTCALSKINEMK